MSGVDTSVAPNVRAGGFIGGSTGEVEVDFDSQRTQIDSFFGGLYVGAQLNNVTFDFAIYGGLTEHERNAVSPTIWLREAFRQRELISAATSFHPKAPLALRPVWASFRVRVFATLVSS